MWTSINKRIYLILSIFLIIGIISGIVFVILLSESSKEILSSNIIEFFKLNKSSIFILISHLLILSTLLVLSILLIGMPLVIFFILYNGFTLGFIISSITSIFGLKGLLYSIIYILINKMLFIILLIIYSTNLFKIAKTIIDYIILKKKSQDIFSIYIKRCIIFISIILLNDVILYIWGLKIVNIFNFLIK